MTEPIRNEAFDSEVAGTSTSLREPALRRQLLRGYSVEDTDMLLRRAATTVETLRTTVNALRDQLAAAGSVENAPAADAEPPQADADALAAMIGKVMISAHEAAEFLTKKAQDEARGLIEQAEAHAAAILAGASEARSRYEEQRDTADQLVEQAKAEAARIVEDARAERDATVAETEDLRRASEAMRRQWIDDVSNVIKQLADVPTLGGSSDNGDIDNELMARVQDSDDGEESPPER